MSKSPLKKCRFEGCKKKESDAFDLRVEGKHIPLCEEHGEYTMQKMLLDNPSAVVSTKVVH